MAWLSVGGAVVSGGLSYLKGAKQKRDAAKLGASNPFPEQQIPQAILENQALAKQYANTGLPSQQYQQAQQGIQRNADRAITSATDRRGGLGMIGQIQQGSNDANLNLNVADANAVNQNRQRLMQQNQQLGQWQNNVWDWNKRQKYMQTAASVRALMGAGNANQNAGLDRLVGGGVSALGANNGAGLKIVSGALGGLFSKKASQPMGNTNPNVSTDAYGNETYMDDYGNPIK